MNLLKQLKKREVRASAQSALVTSTNVPNSGLTFIDNSQGCSAAIAELSGLLDVALDKFDCEGEPGDQLQLQLKRLYNEASNYSNRILGSETAVVNQWDCTRHEAEIVTAAFSCALAVYEPNTIPSLPGFIFKKEASISPSIGGTTKATEIYVVKRIIDGAPDSNSLLPMLVIAIRGTASRVDSMVNMNGDSRELDIFNLKDLAADSSPFSGHAGFLNGAEDLMPFVSKKIKEITVHNQVQHILFTGHSAGGAVSSLLFVKHLFCAAVDYPSLKFSSITFGAPPVTQPSLDTYVLGPQLAKRRGLVLSVVNEYDLVPRTDRAYIRSLVDLYRSIYNLPPMQDDNPQLKSPSLDLPHFSFEKDAIVEKTKEMLWPLSNPDYWHIGKIVVFKTELVEGEGPDDEDVLLLKAVTVRPEDFAKLLWCNVAVHKRVRYGERVELLGYGRFNGRNGW